MARILTRRWLTLLSKFNLGTLAVAVLLAPQLYPQYINRGNGIRQVLLVSIDGMHALDYENCVNSGHARILRRLEKRALTTPALLHRSRLTPFLG